MTEKKDKGVIRRLLHFVFVVIFVFACIALVKEILARQNLPQRVIVAAGSPLTCNLLETPKTIAYLTALY